MNLSDSLPIETEVCEQTVPPLFDKGLAVDDHQSGHAVTGDEGTRNDRLPGSWRRNKYA